MSSPLMSSTSFSALLRWVRLVKAAKLLLSSVSNRFLKRWRKCKHVVELSREEKGGDWVSSECKHCGVDMVIERELEKHDSPMSVSPSPLGSAGLETILDSWALKTNGRLTIFLLEMLKLTSFLLSAVIMSERPAEEMTLS